MIYGLNFGQDGARSMAALLWLFDAYEPMPIERLRHGCIDNITLTRDSVLSTKQQHDGIH
jgi:hypothetical protein